MNKDGDAPKDIHFRDIAPAIEFVCWVVVALAPLLRLINGPAVTDDQFAIQVTIFSVALLGALGLRLYHIFRRRRVCVPRPLRSIIHALSLAARMWGDAMRWIAGLLLVCAAVLKAAELLNEPPAMMANPLGRFFLPIQVGVELVVGLVALSGLYWRILRWFIVLLFTGFAGYTLYLAMSGAASCGCFGPLQVNPWWTFFLDLAVVLGLLASSVRGGREQGADSRPGDARLVGSLVDRRKVIAAAMGLAVVTTALLMRYVDKRMAVAEGGMVRSGDLVILEPERWIGQKLPIADFIDIDLSSGEWIAVLHRHDCPACREALPRYEQLASTGQRVALIEVPPYGHSHPLESACYYGRLKDDRERFVQTPVEIQLRDGIVRAAKTLGH